MGNSGLNTLPLDTDVLSDSRTKRCSLCGEQKPLTSFYSSRGKPASRCKNCTYTSVLAWRRAHPDKVSEQNRRCRAKHPDPRSKPRLRKEPQLKAAPRLRKEPRPKAAPRQRMTEAERLARRRAYREAHREELREYHRQYWQEYQRTHHPEILAKKAKYRARLKERRRNP